MDSNQESEISETREIITSDEKKPDGFKDQLANFFIRILAYILDRLFLGIVGLVVVVIFYFISKDFLIQIGQKGRLIGLVIAMAYFGILNSRIGNGQTFGKKIFKIKVVNKQGNLITLWRSCLRSLILILPIFINGITFDVSLIGKLNVFLYIIMGLIFLLLMSISIGLVYFYIFNGQTRQAIHDLIAGTLVVKKGIKDWQEFKPVKKFHYYVYTGIIMIILIGSSVLLFSFKSSISEIFVITDKIKPNKNFQVIGISTSVNKSISSNSNLQTFRKLTIQVKKFNRNLDSYDIAYEIVPNILREYSKVDNYDFIEVSVTMVYDIGILKGGRTIFFHGSPNDWRTRKISKNKSMKGIQLF